jgi:hypothetical protein
MSLFSNESHAFELEVEQEQSELVRNGCPENQARWRAEQVVWSRALLQPEAPRQCRP